MLMIALFTTVMFRIDLTSAQITGDIDGDDDVDIYDVTLAAGQYMVDPSDPSYDSTIVQKADLAEPKNGIIDILDLVTIISHYTGSK